MPSPKPYTDESVVHLTAADVERLLSADHGGEARFDVAGKITQGYAGDAYAEGQRVIAEQVFRALVRDTELRVRLVMAEHLHKSNCLPRDVAMTMAQDPEDAVALPMLKYSEVLTEDDLVSLVRATEAAARQVAVSERKEVPPRLAGELLSKGKPEVAQALAANAGAQLDEQMLGAIVEHYSRDGGIMQALASRAGLPLPLASKVLDLVSGGAADNLRKKYQLTEDDLRSAAERAREGATLELLQRNGSPHAVITLVEQLASAGQLTHSLLLNALCRGHVHFFESGLARLSGVPSANAHALLTDNGDLGFRAIYNKAGLPPEMFGAVRLLLSVVRDLNGSREARRGEHLAHRVIEQFREVAEASPVEHVDTFISMLRNGLH